MKKIRKTAIWALVHASSGKLIVVDARVPVFWLRGPAQDFARDYGFRTSGPNANAKAIRTWLHRL
jgi:hypothetical protein